MGLTELQSLIDLLRENGVTQYKNGDLELSLGPGPKTQESLAKEEVVDQELVKAEKALRSLPNGQNYAKMFGVAGA